MTFNYNDDQTLVLFRLAGQRYALGLDVVVRIIRAVAPTPAPETPDFILGLINLAGKLLPVFSLRRCLGLPEAPIQPEDHLMIVRTAGLQLAMVVDAVENLRVVNASHMVAVEDALPGGGGCRAQGLVKIDGDIIFIYDLDRVLNPEDRERILQAQAAAAAAQPP
jgi:purine-binding chemotaxis protein CheW